MSRKTPTETAGFFMSEQLHNLIRVLTSRDDMPLLPQNPWQPEISAQITALRDSELFDERLSASQKLNVRAGLLLWNDDLDAAHELVQDGRDATECFWHAIIHRREGDFGNANYWWARTGTHPAFEPVRQAVLEDLQDEPAAQEFRHAISTQWQPGLLVQRVEEDRGRESAWLRRVQKAEMRTLLDWCLGEKR
jgi:hypothetical protein